MTRFTLEQAEFLIASDHVMTWTREPGECKRCHALHYAFVNRHGRTLCVGCDATTNREVRYESVHR